MDKFTLVFVNIVGISLFFGHLCEGKGLELCTLVDKSTHGVSGTVYAVDNTKLYIENLNYDGQGPDAFFWVGEKGVSGSTADSQGTIIQDENGSMEILKAYNNADVLLRLTNGMTVSNLQWISVWCRRFGANFGDCVFPNPISNIPAPYALPDQMTQLTSHVLESGTITILDEKTFKLEQFNYDGTGPDAFFVVGVGSSFHYTAATDVKIPDENGSLDKLGEYTSATIEITLPGDHKIADFDWLSVYCIAASQDFGHVTLNIPSSVNIPPYFDMGMMYDNCEHLHDYLNVYWTVEGSKIHYQLVGSLEDDGYMAFGTSGSTTSTAMIGADVAVASLRDGFEIVDYKLNAYSQCSVGNGACPDTMITNGKNDLDLKLASDANGLATVQYSRSLVTGDASDMDIDVNAMTQIVWALGPLNIDGTVAKHSLRTTVAKKIQFGRSADATCEPVMKRNQGAVVGWEPLMISGRDTKEITLRIGPTGGDRGYKSITGRTGWGIAIYANGQLIPEIEVRRGDTFTFKVETGDDTNNDAFYHPVYITDDEIGGYKKKTDAAKMAVETYGTLTDAGEPITAGKYCEYAKPLNIDPASYDSFPAFFDELNLDCKSGLTGQFTWTPDANTPDTVYYQCYTHNYLGWKINVVDEYTSSAVGVNYWMSLVTSIIMMVVVKIL